MQENDFRSKLSPERYRIMREKGTEVAYTGKYWDSNEGGTYRCAACGNPLFSSSQKVDSKDGWPAFALGGKNKNIIREFDATGREEISCKKCRSHLGYMVEDGRRMRINSIALDFSEDPELDLELPDKEEEEEREKSDERAKEMSQAASGVSLGSVGIFIAGAAVGGIVGGAAGFLMCQSASDIPSATISPAANSEVEIVEIIAPTPTPIQSSKPRTDAPPVKASGVATVPLSGSMPSVATSSSVIPGSGAR
ncbi:hypothetical protein A3A39_00825 [Candidatus Kaiserbacteria bacterium RIFCSPLOWO2_01_FULL_54_13]|uniref:peptide-methionine (R)-S-oxide reductase n=1 Tax=Candidatus Kaiserbacteria bacterium RIFCSPLOWO2_01_FULL_54_13 TaxID=1798512 RepID=A0A1F6F115_9BACT|nr:MAG: hypothetical protein A3A39_00825 [Candidatus Kaiserbacteria bacterium RIFCSPLOWO2_01_FULL_54_13]